MGYEILGSFIGFVLFPLVIGGFVLFWRMTNEQRDELEGSFRSLAERHGRSFIPATGEWPNRTSAGVAWTKDGTRFRLDSVGKEGGARTRLVAWPSAKLLGTLVVSPTPDGGRFEQSFTTHAKPKGFEDRLLDERAKKALLAFRQADDVRLAYRRGRLVLTWPGREMNEARIHEAERVLKSLAQSVDAAFHQHQRAA